MNALRADLAQVVRWIRPGSRVLDLGCGDGHLLRTLREQRQVTGYGLEIDPDEITGSLANGVNVIQTDLDAGLPDFEAGSFDYVVMTQTLQAVRYPRQVLDEILRIGREGIVTFPNFAHWRLRLYLSFWGRMPMSRALGYMWYDTPNIHLCTIHDFEELCRERNIVILERRMLSGRMQPSAVANLLPNLLAEIAVYRIQRG